MDLAIIMEPFIGDVKRVYSYFLMYSIFILGFISKEKTAAMLHFYLIGLI